MISSSRTTLMSVIGSSSSRVALGPSTASSAGTGSTTEVTDGSSTAVGSSSTVSGATNSVVLFDNDNIAYFYVI